MKLLNKKTLFYGILLLLLCFFLYQVIPLMVKEHKISKLQTEKIKIQTEIDGLNTELQGLKDSWEIYCGEKSILKEGADTIRDNISVLDTKIVEIDNTLIKILDIKIPSFEEGDSDLTGIAFDNSGLWRVNKNGYRHKLYNLDGTTVNQRIKSLLGKFGIASTYDSWIKYGDSYGIKPELAVCIAFADTSLGAQTKTTNNIGNVGNNDRGDKVYFNTLDGGIEAMFKTLNNQYMKGYDKIGMLSQGGRTILKAKGCAEQGEFCYATSEENWGNNVINCMNLLYWNSGEVVDENFIFRK